MKNIHVKSAIEEHVITRQFVSTVQYEILNSNGGCHAVEDVGVPPPPRSLAWIADSNPIGGMDVCLV